MKDLISRLVASGVTDAQSHPEQRRIRTINAVALIAIAGDLLFTPLFQVLSPINNLPTALYLTFTVFFIAAYALGLWLNSHHRHEAAVVLITTTGSINLAAATLSVGFDIGPGIFLVAVAVGAVLITSSSNPALRWGLVVGSVALYAVLVIIDPPAPDSVIDTPLESFLVTMIFAGTVAFVVGVVWYQRRLADRAEEALTAANELNERLLLNILPAEIAERLKSGEYPIADAKPGVSILFADIVGSTEITERLTAEELITTLDGLFSAFDDIAAAHGLEKIKTQGDSYFAVAGLSDSDSEHAARACRAALAMRDELALHQFPHLGQVQMRFGLHPDLSSPV